MYCCYGNYNNATIKSEIDGKIATNVKNTFIIAQFSWANE